MREGPEQADFDRERELLEPLVDRVIVTDGAVETRYVVPTGPNDEREPFGDCEQTAYWGFRRFPRRLLFRTIRDVAPMLDRGHDGGEPSPSAGVVDSQGVKGPAALGGGGYDAARRAKGRKRHVVADRDGRPSMVNPTSADVQDVAGAEATMRANRRRWPRLKHLFAEGACDRGRLTSRAAYRGFVIETVRSQAGGSPGLPGAAPALGDGERSFGRLTRWPRLVPGYGERCDVSGAMIFVGMGSLLLHRIAYP